jgi:SpoVK/Ycf46/Vps4 family AAA+-type ATPase
MSNDNPASAPQEPRKFNNLRQIDNLWEGASGGTIFRGSGFPHFKYYLNNFDCHPNVFSSEAIVKSSIIKNIIDKGAEEVHLYEMQSNKNSKKKKTIVSLEHSFIYKDAMIIVLCERYYYRDVFAESEIQDNNEKDDRTVKVLYQKKETLNEIVDLFEYVHDKVGKNINLLCYVDDILSLANFTMNLPQEDFDLELNYGKELKDKANHLEKELKKNKSGLALFSGLPGTGKSTFIKYISTITDRKIIYLPSNIVSEITSPSFISFMTQHSNSILILEDAEKALVSREIQENVSVSSILNMTDGILGDCMNLFIVATINTDRDNIDPALLRKGRLIVEHQFDKLSPEECNKLFEKNKSERRTEVPLSLAEIYNDQDNYVKKEERKKVGF